jgi:hypothetical protein
MTPLAVQMKKNSDSAQLECREIESEQELHHVNRSTSVPTWDREY